MEERITIKGSREGLRLTLHPDAPWDEVLHALRTQLDQGSAFYQGAKLLIDIGERATTDVELHDLLEVMQEYGLEPEALVTATPAIRAMGRNAGLEPRHPDTTRPPTLPTTGDEGTFVWRTVRSGQEVRHAGHVVVVGDVNAGAEIVAGGNIIIWGRLRGTAHAGAMGDTRAVVYALELKPTMLRIAELFARTPDNHRPGGPEQALLDGEQIIVVPWDAPRR